MSQSIRTRGYCSLSDIIQTQKCMNIMDVDELTSICEKICDMKINNADINAFKLFLEYSVKQNYFVFSYKYFVDVFIGFLLNIYDDKHTVHEKPKKHNIVIRKTILDLIKDHIFKPDQGWFNDDYTKSYLRNNDTTLFFYYFHLNYYRLFDIDSFEELRETNPVTFTYAILALSCKCNLGDSYIRVFFNKSQKYRKSWSSTFNEHIRDIPAKNKLLYVFMNENTLPFLMKHLSIDGNSHFFLDGIKPMDFNTDSELYERTINVHMPINLLHDNISHRSLFNELILNRDYFFMEGGHIFMDSDSSKSLFWDLYKKQKNKTP